MKLEKRCTVNGVETSRFDVQSFQVRLNFTEQFKNMVLIILSTIEASMLRKI